MKQFFRRAYAAAAAIALSCTALTAFPARLRASAASTEWKFDFGAGGVAGGYTGVSASDGYNSSRGYGFSSGTAVTNVSASGSGALSDAVQFTNATATGNYTFCADVPNGLYQVSVWLGNTNRTSVGIERMLQIVNMTGNNAYHTLQVPVTDGQLNICVCAGKEGYAYTLSALEIKQISTQTHTNPTIWVCGDSTVCNYYPLDSSSQAGWAQMLPQFIDKNKWQVMNMAASGQWARGFMQAGQFDVIEKNGQPGDIYVVSIGINDTNAKNDTTESQYEEIITDMAKRAMAKGMRVILVKQQGRNGDCQRNPLLEYRWYAPALDRVGAALNIEVVNLFKLWQDYCLTKTADQVSAMYLDDGLHPNRSGATVLAQFMADAINSGSSNPGGTEFSEGTTVMFRNLESGYYLSAEDGKAASGTNVSQTADGSVSPKNVWKLVSAGEGGAYYIYSMVGGGRSYVLDVANGATANETNIDIRSKTDSHAQVFKLIQNGDYYHIATAVTDYRSYVGIWGGSHDEKGNAIEWENDGTNNQKWQLQYVQYSEELPLLQGDLDGDGRLTAKDLTLLKQFLLSGGSDIMRIQASDLNADLTVDGKDAAALRSYLLGESTEFSGATYPAVHQNYKSGIHENMNEGSTFPEYLNLENTNVSGVTFTVNVPKDGNCALSLRYANGSANNRDMMVSVSGNAAVWKLDFLTTSAWTQWAEQTIVLPLTAGINYITLQSNTAEGGPNFDYLRLMPTDEPVAEPYDPNSQPGIIVTDNPVIYIASDSVAQSYDASYAPMQGWGYYLKDYFTDAVAVSNHAMAGRSSKKFYNDGRYGEILKTLKAGDYVLICFAINDADYTKEDRYAPVCGDINNPAEGNYEYYIKYFIESAMEKGATPILMSPTLSIKKQSQPFKGGYLDYAECDQKFAAKYNIPYFDLNGAMVSQWNNTAFDTVYNYYYGSKDGPGQINTGDFTHLNTTGAPVVAKIVANGIKGMNIGLSGFVK